MPYTEDKLRAIYDRTSGYCHICGKKLAFTNYGQIDARGCWEVEHSVPLVSGGTDRLNNLYASCISCNRYKRDGSTRAARAQNGRMRAPLSRSKRAEQQATNTTVGAALGALAGFLVFGPPGALICGGIGAAAGKATKVG